ncbi:MAG: hypothetical protein IT405_03435 [Candidatus Yanofskybacteria bacterium]|nr:hypothetical protein [Candidatus Yanofskybacteria bacterium]
MKWLLVSIFAVFGWVSVATAAPYTEFAPDYAQSLMLASSETASEIFLPLNEYLSGLDVWLSNTNTAGPATFSLYNPAGALVAERTLTVPALADGDTGTRIHVALPAQIAVHGNEAYRMRITSTVPTMQLYYATAQKLLAHNGTPLPAYTNGIARLGDEDTAFSFLYALYESSETTPPQIANVTITQTSPTQVVISFTSNEPVDRRVQYGSSTLDWTGQYASCLTGVQTCTATLPVIPGTTYPYTLTARDTWGNASSTTGTFTVPSTESSPSPTASAVPASSPPPAPSPTPSPTPDTTAPIITNARTVTITPTSATFAWTTNEIANSTVVAQLTPILITIGGNSDATLELEHYITVGNLTPDTYFRATITSTDGSGNRGRTTVDFLTPKETTATPAPSQPSPTVTTVPTSSPATVSTTNTGGSPSVSWPSAPSGQTTTGYRIDVFDAGGTLVKSATVSPEQYRLTLDGLADGEYRVVVYANHDGAYEKVAPPAAVRVRTPSLLEQSVSAAPYVLGGIALILAVSIGILKLKKPTTATAPPEQPPRQSGAQTNPTTFG